jgi:hypothetical protein
LAPVPVPPSNAVGSEHALVHHNDVYDTHLLIKVNMASQRREWTLVFERKASHAPKIRGDNRASDRARG